MIFISTSIQITTKLGSNYKIIKNHCYWKIAATRKIAIIGNYKLYKITAYKHLQFLNTLHGEDWEYAKQQKQ